MLKSGEVTNPIDVVTEARLKSGFEYLHHSKELPPNHQSTPMAKEPTESPKLLPSYRPVSLSFTETYNNGHSADKQISFRNQSSYYQTSPNLHSNINTRETSNGNYRKSFSPVNSKLTDVDANTILRQRHELQLMITELKDRDRELNELVSSHHQQLLAWEVDRQRLVVAENELKTCKAELKKRHVQCKLMKERIKTSETDLCSKTKELEFTQKQLRKLSKEANESTTCVEELKAKNETLKTSVEDLSKTLGTVQAKDQQISTILRLKDKDIKDANQRIEELTLKLQKCNKSLLQFKQKEDDRKNEVDKLREENIVLRQDLNDTKETLANQSNTSIGSKEEVEKMKQEIVVLQKELIIAGEREKRKESLLDLSKSKQERTETELKHMRKLYDRLQKDLSQLKEQAFRDDDEISVITLSDMDPSNSTPLEVLDAFEKLTVMKSSTEFLTEEKKFQLKTSQEEKDDSTPLAKKSPKAPQKSENDISFQTVESSDVGEMTAAELKDSNIVSYIIASNKEEYQDQVLDESMSPTSRLHKLLSESRQMIKNLENSPTFSSPETTPEKIEFVEEFPTPSVALNFEGNEEGDTWKVEFGTEYSDENTAAESS